MRNWITISLFTFFLIPTAPAQTSREDRWRQDLDFFADTVQRTHPGLFTRISREEFGQAIEEIKGNVDQWQDYQVLTAMMRITSRIGDAHTSVTPTSTGLLRSYPVQFRLFSSGLHVTAAGGSAIPALGRKLVAIDGQPAADAWERIKTIVAFENPSWASLVGAQYLSFAELLHGVGITEARGTAVFEFEGDLKITLAAGQNATVAFPRKASPRRPLYQLNQGLFYWFDYLPEEKALYVKYDVCADDPSLPAAEFGRQIVEFLKGKPFERAVIDLRHNSGGDSSVLQRFVAPLAEAIGSGVLTPPREIFAIIGRQTFSSGMLNAIDLKLQGATLVGEPTGGIPNGFGEVRAFNLPNSGWRFQVSTRLFQIPGFSGLDAVMPDIPVDFTIQDMAGERDPYLNAILHR